MNAWNETTADYPQAVFPDLFAAQTLRTPRNIALECAGQSITYAELDARSNAVAAHLTAQGVGPETLVGILVERSGEMVAGLLGI